MIAIFTHATGRGFTACSQAGPDDPRSNFPPTRLGVRANSKDEATAALNCARRAVRLLQPYMVSATSVQRRAPGFWIVRFEHSSI